MTLAATACVVAPWTLRNYLVVDRFIPTSAGGGLVLYLAHHDGARGGNDFRAARDFQQRHKRDDFSQAVLAQYDAGRREAWRFVVEHPREELAIQWRKLALTYGSDGESARLVRAVGRRPRLERPVYLRLVRIADVAWYGIAALALVGLTTLRSWPREARVLLLGLVLTWFGLHVVFLAGPRFRAPESIAYAIFAARGLERLVALPRRARAP